MMRILQIAHDHPDWTTGGTEIVAHDLARALAARPGISARLMVAATSLHRPDALPGGLGRIGEDLVLRTGAYDRFMMNRLDGTDWVETLTRLLAVEKPDIVHLHGLDRIGGDVLPVIRRQAPNCRIVLTLHDYQLICANEGLMLTTTDGARCRGASPDACRRCFPDQTAARHALRRAHLLAVLNAVDLFIAPSRFLRDRFVAWGLDPARVLLLPNAVAATPALSGPDPEPQRARRNRFGFFGSIARHKGVLTLLEAAARAGGDVSVTLHGGLGYADDGFRADFGRALAAAGQAAQHVGPYHRDEAVALMRTADWIVVPSLWWENSPLVMLEAQAAGRPVVCSGIGGMAELVEHGRTGLHFAPGNAAALAEAMQEASDPEVWRRMVRAPEPPRHEAFVNAHVGLYHDLLARVPA